MIGWWGVPFHEAKIIEKIGDQSLRDLSLRPKVLSHVCSDVPMRNRHLAKTKRKRNRERREREREKRETETERERERERERAKLKQINTPTKQTIDKRMPLRLRPEYGAHSPRWQQSGQWGPSQHRTHMDARLAS